MQNIISNIIKIKNTAPKSGSPKLTLLWTKNQMEKSNPAYAAWITIGAGALIIAFAFFNSDALLKELIASGLMIGMIGMLQWMTRFPQRPVTKYYKDTLN